MDRHSDRLNDLIEEQNCKIAKLEGREANLQTEVVDGFVREIELLKAKVAELEAATAAKDVALHDANHWLGDAIQIAGGESLYTAVANFEICQRHIEKALATGKEK